VGLAVLLCKETRTHARYRTNYAEVGKVVKTVGRNCQKRMYNGLGLIVTPTSAPVEYLAGGQVRTIVLA
jgi:hypothetical protein